MPRSPLIRLSSARRRGLSGARLCSPLALAAGAPRRPRRESPAPADRRVAVDVASTAGETRFYRRPLSSRSTASAFVLARPDRVVIDLPRGRTSSSPPEAGRQGGGLDPLLPLRPVRARPLADRHRPRPARRRRRHRGRARPAPADAGPPRRRTRPGRPREPSARRAAAERPGRVRRRLPRSRRPPADEPAGRSCIDPGHGGIDPGRGGCAGDLAEKDDRPRLRPEAADKLEATGATGSCMTRDERRLRLASATASGSPQRQQADLVHLDPRRHASRRGQDVRGATIYTGSERRLRRRVGAPRRPREPAPTRSPASTGGSDADEDVADILHGPHAARDAGLLEPLRHAAWSGELGFGRAPATRIPTAQAGFRVLRAPGRALGADRARLSVEPQGPRALISDRVARQGDRRHGRAIEPVLRHRGLRAPGACRSFTIDSACASHRRGADQRNACGRLSHLCARP